MTLERQFLSENKTTAKLLAFTMLIHVFHAGHALSGDLGVASFLSQRVAEWLLSKDQSVYAAIDATPVPWERMLNWLCQDKERQAELLTSIMCGIYSFNTFKDVQVRFFDFLWSLRKMGIPQLNLLMSELNFKILFPLFLSPNGKMDFAPFIKTLTKQEFVGQPTEFRTAVFKFLLKLYKEYREFRHESTGKNYSNKWGKLFGVRFGLKQEAVLKLLQALEDGQSIVDFMNEAKQKPYHNALKEGRLGAMCKFFYELQSKNPLPRPG